MKEPLTYRFYAPSRVTDIQASSISEARRRYMAKGGQPDVARITIVKDETND